MNSLLADLRREREIRCPPRQPQHPAGPDEAYHEPTGSKESIKAPADVIDICDSDDEPAPKRVRSRAQEDADRALAERLAREDDEDHAAALQNVGTSTHGLDPVRQKSHARGSARVLGSYAGTTRVGTCGFSQIRIVPSGYPVPDAKKHEYYAERFGCAELDSVFYKVPGEPTFRAWRRLAEQHANRSDAYQLIPKLNQYFTHMKRLIVDDVFKSRFEGDMQRFALLGDRCPCILVQFNGTSGGAHSRCFERTADTHSRLVAFAELLATRTHVVSGGEHGTFDPIFVLELRHASWYCEDVYRLVESHPRLTLAQIHHQGCSAKFGGMEDGWWPAHRVAERLWRGKLCYVRLHGTIGFCLGDYGRDEMKQLGARMQSYVRADAGTKAYALFNNDGFPSGQPCFAVCDGFALGEALSSA